MTLSENSLTIAGSTDELLKRNSMYGSARENSFNEFPKASPHAAGALADNLSGRSGIRVDLATGGSG